MLLASGSQVFSQDKSGVHLGLGDMLGSITVFSFPSWFVVTVPVGVLVPGESAVPGFPDASGELEAPGGLGVPGEPGEPDGLALPGDPAGLVGSGLTLAIGGVGGVGGDRVVVVFIRVLVLTLLLWPVPGELEAVASPGWAPLLLPGAFPSTPSKN